VVLLRLSAERLIRSRKASSSATVNASSAIGFRIVESGAAALVTTGARSGPVVSVTVRQTGGAD
jgi:hypothetical protein